jgi:hypothetical protein
LPAAIAVWEFVTTTWSVYEQMQLRSSTQRLFGNDVSPPLHTIVGFFYELE